MKLIMLQIVGDTIHLVEHLKPGMILAKVLYVDEELQVVEILKVEEDENANIR